MRELWSLTIECVNRGELSSARAAFASFISTSGKGNYDLAAATLILGELIANACLHGRPPVRIELYEENGTLLLRVADAGSGIVRPQTIRPFDSVSGRGFEIVETLGGRVAIAAPPVSAVTVTLPLSP